MAALDVKAFAAAQLALLAAEQQAEVAETALLTATHAPSTLARAGLAITNLTLSGQRTGLGGKTVLELAPDPALSGGRAELAEHGLRVGDIVGVSEQPRGAERKRERAELERQTVQGVVVRVMREVIVVALDRDEVDVPGGRLWLVKLADDVTFKRMNQAIERLQGMGDAEHSRLSQVLLGMSSPTPASQADLQAPIDWRDDTLDDSQKDAIRFALASREVALIHGPPGTGKTHTLIELIVQLVKEGKRLLVCGPSNIAVDNIVERLSSKKIAMVRLGHPARLLPGVLNHSLEVLTKNSDAAELVNDIRQELDAKQVGIRKTRNGRERKAIYGEMKDLRKEYRQREAKCVDDLVRGSKVVLATLHGAGGYQLKGHKFDVIVIDEASQALEASCWIPLLGYGAGKVVLAGDHLQLPPTIKLTNAKGTEKNEKSEKKGGAGLEKTMFDRVLETHGNDIKRMLTTQYRMHELIMQYPSGSLYDGKLVAAESIRHRTLAGLPYGAEQSDDTTQPLVWYDTQGGDFPEQADEEESGTTRSSLFGDSKRNPSEAQIVKVHVERLVGCGVRTEDIAVITPYNGQVAVLSKLLKEAHPGIEVGSVDGFQGREKEAVIVSLVRSNTAGDVGFLSDKRRLNVAMTRAKRHLCVVGDSETVGRGGRFLKEWMAFLEDKAELRYPEPGEMRGGG